MQVTMFDPGNYTPYYVDNLCQALAGHGARVTLITSSPLFENTCPSNSYGVEYLFFKTVSEGGKNFFRRRPWLRQPLKVLSYPVGLWRTWQTLKSRAPGILHIQWSLLPVLDSLLAAKLRSRGWRVVYTAHDVDSELGSRVRRWRSRRIYRQTDAAIVHAHSMAKLLREDSGDVLRKIQTIPEGIATFPLKPELNRSCAHAVLDLKKDGPLLLFFGLIKPYKGLESLLRAWPRVVEEFPQARLLIAGEALQPFGPLDQLIDQLQIRESVLVRLGYVPQSEAQYFFRSADAAVLPYLRISTSSVVPLAYQFACPVIATSVGGLPEIVQDGQTGFLVPPSSPDALAEAICRGFREPARLAHMGTQARSWFESERSWSRVANMTMDLYRSLGPRDPA
jgi:glycosyltransferase involved in cell wall biosynthesis